MRIRLSGKPTALPDRKDRRIDGQLQQERSDEAADHRRGDPLHHISAGAVAPQHLVTAGREMPEGRNGDDPDLIPMIVISPRIKQAGMTSEAALDLRVHGDDR